MQKYFMHNILQQPIGISKLEVQSFEMNVYLVKLHVNENSGFVYDKHDRPMRFHSSQQIRDYFALCSVEKSVMVHDSPYDEMIGNPNKPDTLMEMPFSMQQPY